MPKRLSKTKPPKSFASRVFPEALFIPSKRASDRLLIVMHGRGDSREGFAWFPDALELPSVNYFIPNAPDMWDEDDPLSFSWYDLDPNQGPGVERSRKLLFKLLHELNAAGFPYRRIGVCGFSQGCLMSIDVGLRFPEKLAGILGMSGYVFFEDEYPRAFSSVAREQNWLVTHGTFDRALSIVPTRKQIRRLIDLGIPIEWREYRKAHVIDTELEIEHTRTYFKFIFGIR